jgi:flagellar basal-body rod protein FlgC
MVYDPTHPDADEEGFVAMPDIDPLEEMVEMMTASRAYEANITAVQTAKEMFKKALDI